MDFIKEFEDLRIPLEAIKSATNNFDNNNYIGQGGFGKVYKGELLLSQGQTMVAIKRLQHSDLVSGQGPVEFWKEILMLTRYRHKNIVALLGFCHESGENILVYEYLSNKSLDLYLSDVDLSWKQRLQICIGAARGLRYLHNSGNTQERVLHRDIKSANILLDDNWEAKISDFGLSKIGPANQQFTFLVSNAVGTFGYCDPLYMETGFLTKESDIYSFGVVLYEILCGRFCVGKYDDIRKFLPALAQKCYTEEKLDTIIHNGLREQISPECLQKFSTIAYRCLRRERKERPIADEIVEELEVALEYQVKYETEKEELLMSKVDWGSDSELYWETMLPCDWEIIVSKFPHVVYTNKKELFSLLHKGILFDEGRKFFSIDDDGNKCELISVERFLDLNRRSYRWVRVNNSRFECAAELQDGHQLNHQLHVRTSMLSPGIMYAASLVFIGINRDKLDMENSKGISIKWKSEDLSISSTHFAEPIKNNWFKIRMWHFISYEKNADFDIVLDSIVGFRNYRRERILILGMEFRPVEFIEEQESVSISDEDVDWEKNMPHDYQDIIQRSNMHLEYTSNKELYFLLCDGILIDNGRTWFSLCKSTGGKCHMLLAEDIFDSRHFDRLSLSESRFKKVIQFKSEIEEEYHKCYMELQSDMFSPGNVYACYLVFKFKDYYNAPGDEDLFVASLYFDFIAEDVSFSHLDMIEPINIPIIKPKNDSRSHVSTNTPRTEVLRIRNVYTIENQKHSWTELRNDGWMEVILFSSLHKLEERKSMRIEFEMIYLQKALDEIIVEGIEFRPMPTHI